jgi:hypothetical protein
MTVKVAVIYWAVGRVEAAAIKVAHAHENLPSTAEARSAHSIDSVLRYELG